MKNAPILLALDLWSLGHSAAAVAQMVGLPNHKHVTRIVQRARSIGDKRAVLHVADNGRLIGRAGHAMIPPVAIPVPALGKALCAAGHPRVPENLSSAGHCKTCKRLQDAERYRKRKL